jgi:membrane protein implicated in regulation of membrane protease activity
MSGWDWNAIYLTCFAVGLALSFVAFFGGATHVHLGKLHLHGHGLAKSGRGHGASPVNGFTVVAFLCWFGGTGYLMHEAHVFNVTLVLVFSAISGFAGAFLVFWFLVKVLMPKERTVEPEDTEIVGVVGRLSTVLTDKGFGEMLYSQNGGRRCATVRSEGHTSIERGTEVLVMRYEGGVAYVRRWDEFEDGLLRDEGHAEKTAKRERLSE